MPSHHTRGAIASFLGCVLLAACAPEAPPPPPLTIWHSLPSAEARVLTELVAPLQAAHPDWGLTAKAMGQEAVLARLGQPEGPDAALVSLSTLATLVKDKKLLPLDAHLSERDRLDFLPAAWKLVNMDSHTWAVPFELSVLGLAYRKSALAAAKVAPPATLTDLMLRGAAFRKAAPNKVFLSLPTDSAVLAPFLWANGGTLATDDHWKSTTRYLLTLRSRQVIGPFHQTAASTVEVMASGRAAMAIVAPEQLPRLATLTATDDVGLLPLPSGSDLASSPMVGRAWVVSAKVDRLEAAVAAIGALGGRPNAAAWNARMSRLPARVSAYDEPIIRQRPVLSLFRDQIAGARLISESDKAAMTALTAYWRPYLVGQKKLEVPKPAAPVKRPTGVASKQPLPRGR
jgi:ABC-type glycerol-3-phosphate transport system substrate-binding protein